MAQGRILLDLRPLRESAPFRRVFIARTISIFGIGMLMVGVPIQMYSLTESSFLVGLVASVEGGAAIGGMLIGGSLADRYDRRTLILFARTVSGITFVGLAINAMLDSPSVVAIFVLAVVNGLIGSISVAALFAVIPALISKDQLVGAGALNVLSARAGSVVSPALGGVVIAAASVAWNYWIAAAGTAITVALLSGLPSMRPPEHDAESSGTDGSPEHGNSVLRFLARSPVVGGVIAAGMVAMIGGGVLVLVPGLVDERYGGDSRAAGLLYAAAAVGAVAATVTSGWLTRARRPGLVLLVALPAGFAVQALVGWAAGIAVAFAILAVAGAVSSVQEVLRYSIIQTHTPSRMLGRVNGLWSAQEVAGLSVGAFVAGVFGTVFSASDAIVYYSLSAVVLALVLFVVLGSLRRVAGGARISEFSSTGPAAEPADA
ncbi:enterobactin transporter EntS [Rhodococcus triatomae]|uniref:Multidrug efflux pump Tap n=1 Tax=Rhodococcus triatomae TaxID=300028 RepID=A0A1G7ZMI8_9NOCA|nr:enterobactin transporter EntS [Rhodococcus triatomae]QNG18002.1 enterobactin transporter EntS [Rhodococcus triatomae]QNG22329.1 enterobactin transporter EntS [Rhodococcus triatomae]SDH09884.1 MFS transporter, ENTS family, enterobactin (siderophore) exporter [Rhodococcus triatomae]